MSMGWDGGVKREKTHTGVLTDGGVKREKTHTGVIDWVPSPWSVATISRHCKIQTYNSHGNCVYTYLKSICNF
jgi:hypothetical protein